MSRAFEELDRQPTPMGEISVRRRFHPTLQVDVWEVILGDEHLMSSLFTVAEVALGDLGLAALTDTDLDVVVGGLGLGYTARAVLADPRVRSLCVVEALGAVIDWHERDLLPDARLLTDDPRCHLVHGDFFAMVARGEAFGTAPALVDAILVDIDHTPSHVLDPSHAAFYTAEGLVARLPSGSARRASSPCGPTIPPIPTSWPCSAACSPRPTLTSWSSRTPSPAGRRRTRSTSLERRGAEALLRAQPRAAIAAASSTRTSSMASNGCASPSAFGHICRPSVK